MVGDNCTHHEPDAHLLRKLGPLGERQYDPIGFHQGSETLVTSLDADSFRDALLCRYQPRQPDCRAEPALVSRSGAFVDLTGGRGRAVKSLMNPSQVKLAPSRKFEPAAVIIAVILLA